MQSRASARLVSLSRHFSRSVSASNGGSQLPPNTNPRLSRVMSFSKDEPEGSAAVKPEPPQAPEVEFNFPLSEIPKNPLGEGKFIRTAAALIIG